MHISNFFISAFLLELVSAQRNYGFAGGNSGVFGDEAAAENPSTSLEVAIKASGSPPTFISAAALTGPLILPADYLSSTLITPLQIGTPPQPFKILIDTGSFVFWVRDKSCATSSSCRNFPSFDSAASSSFENLPATANSRQSLLYGDGTAVNCSVEQDTITLGSDTALTNSKICFASNIQATPASSLDGIVGYGPKNNPQEDIAEFWPAFIRANPSLPQQMSFWYNTNVSVPTGGAGSVALGGVDNSKFTGPIKYFPITNSPGIQYWALSLNSIANPSGTILASFSNVNCIIDTGTTVLLLDAANTQSLNRQIGAKYDTRYGAYLLDCNSLASLPPLVFYFSQDTSQPLILSGNQLAYVDPKGGVCYSVIQTSDSLKNSKTIIFGAWFLKSFYTVFDYETSKIGFASPTGQLSPNVTVTVPNLGSSSNTLFGLSTINAALIILGAIVAIGLVLFACTYFGRKKVSRNNERLPTSFIANQGGRPLSNNNMMVTRPPPAIVALPPSHMVQVPPNTFDSAPFLEKMDPQSYEYQQMQAMFQSGWLTGNSVFGIPRIISVIKVHSPPKLAEQFFMSESALGYLGTERLFHGAPRACNLFTHGANQEQVCSLPHCAVCRIVSAGFNPLAPTCKSRSRGDLCRFGKGVYFTNSASVANDYTSSSPLGAAQVLMVCDVLPGQKCIPSTSIWTSDSTSSIIFSGTDFQSVYAAAGSLQGEEQGGLEADEWVVGRADQACVRFLVVYENPGMSPLPSQEASV